MDLYMHRGPAFARAAPEMLILSFSRSIFVTAIVDSHFPRSIFVISANPSVRAASGRNPSPNATGIGRRKSRKKEHGPAAGGRGAGRGEGDRIGRVGDIGGIAFHFAFSFLFAFASAFPGDCR